MNTPIYLLCAVMASFIAAGSSHAATHYVKSTASGASNGTSWTNAYTRLQDALAVAVSGDQIWIASGTYKPSTTGDRTQSFLVPSGVGLYGGFNGTEATLAERTYAAGPTILSGDLLDNDNGSRARTEPTRLDNTYNVVRVNSATSTVTFDGLTIQSGHSETYNDTYDRGGGIHFLTSAPGNVVINNCVIRWNTARTGAGWSDDQSYSFDVSSCLILQNQSERGGGVNVGGPFTIKNCAFVQNRTENSRDGYQWGGGLFIADATGQVINCVFASNYAAESGGAIFHNAGNTDVINCTFHGNGAGVSGQTLLNYNSLNFRISNSIIWSSSGGGSVIGNDNYNFGGTYTQVRNSLIQGGYSGSGTVNVISSDPLFTNSASPLGADGLIGTADDGLRLGTGSPAINAGNNTYVPAGTTTDLAGGTRVIGTADMGAYEAVPTISNVIAAQRPGTKLVDITYDLAAAGLATVGVGIRVSNDGGATWSVPASSVSGAIGSSVVPGIAKSIVWNAGLDWPENYSTQLRVQVLAGDPAMPVSGFSYLLPGSFTMGRTSGDNGSDAPPVTVSVSGFYAQQTETTKAQWDEIRTWASSNGYTDLGAGGGKASSHPAYGMSWWDAIKWCNARSQKEGLTPCYTVGGAVMKTGTTVPTVNWSANGYRLPTEAEWEKAARGGVEGKRFPWGTDTIDHTRANYYANSAAHPYDSSGYTTYRYHPSYETGILPYTSPVGSFPANASGLYDMSGNVWEWCWDWYSSTSYVPGASDPVGPAAGINRVFRGGSWYNGADNSRCVERDGTAPTLQNNQSIGFRQVRSIQVGGSIQNTSNVPVDTRSPVLAFQPQSITVAQNAPASFSVAATGSGTLTYQWQKDGVDIPGATSSSYSLASAKPWHIGDYTLKITDSNGTVTSNAATLSLVGINSGIWRGVVAYYPFKNTTTDTTFFMNNGTAEGVFFSPDRFGFAQSACSVTNIAGTSNRIRCGSPQNGIFDLQGDTTITIWLKAASSIKPADGESINGFIAKDEGPGFTNKWILSVYPDRVGVYIRHSDQDAFIYSDSTGIMVDKWRHVTISKIGNKFYFYVDGLSKGSSTHPVALPLVNSEMTLGWAESPFETNYSGDMDDVRIYNRAMSASEVSALYAAENAPNNWRQTHFGSTANSGNAADAADPDRDGLPNLLEYALNLSPNAASRVPAAVQAAGGNLEYTYTRGTAAYNGGTTFQVEWSDDLTTWFTTGVVESLISDDGTHQQVKATLPAGSGDRRFVRLRVQ